MLFPLLWIVSMSLKGDAEQFATPPTLVPLTPVLSNYFRLLGETKFPAVHRQ